MFFKKLTKQEKMEIKKAKYIKKKDKLFPYPKRGYFERVCPYCKKEFIQELFIKKTTWYLFALDGFPLTGEKKPFDIEAHKYTICPHCGFMFFDVNEEDENEPVPVFETFIRNQKDAENLKDPNYTLEEKMLGLSMKIENEYHKGLLYYYGIQTDDKKLMKEVRQWFIKNYEKYKNDKDHRFYGMRKIPKYSFSAITTDSYVYYYPEQMIMDFYRQEGEFDKARELLLEFKKEIDDYLEEHHCDMEALSLRELVIKETYLIDNKITDRI